jgi:hypothetical protein
VAVIMRVVMIVIIVMVVRGHAIRSCDLLAPAAICDALLSDR